MTNKQRSKHKVFQNKVITFVKMLNFVLFKSTQCFCTTEMKMKHIKCNNGNSTIINSVCMYGYQPKGWLDPHTMLAPDAHTHT